MAGFAVVENHAIVRSQGGHRRALKVGSGWRLIGAIVLWGCGVTPIGEIGFLSREPEPVGIKLLQRGVLARSCQTFVLGIAIGARLSVEDALAHLLVSDPEGNAVTSAHLSWHRTGIGLYHRDCLEVQGDLARTISTVTLPHAAHE